MKGMKTSWCVRISYLNFTTNKFEQSMECYFKTRKLMRDSVIVRTLTNTQFTKVEYFKVLSSEEHNTRVYFPRPVKP